MENHAQRPLCATQWSPCVAVFIDTKQFCCWFGCQHKSCVAEKTRYSYVLFWWICAIAEWIYRKGSCVTQLSWRSSIDQCVLLLQSNANCWSLLLDLALLYISEDWWVCLISKCGKISIVFWKAARNFRINIDRCCCLGSINVWDVWRRRGKPCEKFNTGMPNSLQML